MNKYIAQPQFVSNTIGIYDITNPAAPTLFQTLTASPDIAALVGTYDPNNPSGPNSVLVYQDLAASPSPLTSSPQQFLLIAYVGGGGKDGAVYVFDLDKLFTQGAGTVQLPAAPVEVLKFPGYTPIGMAVQPGTGDLYVATPSTTGGNPTVTVFAKTQGAAWSGNGDPTIVTFAASGFSTTPSNFAFDAHGFLWMTSFGQNDGTPDNYLTCFRDIPNATPTATPEFWFDNHPDAGGAGTQLAVTPLLGTAPAKLFGLSSPEGVAFDPAGNLWVANNNEEYVGSDVNPKFGNAGGGSLLMIKADYLLSTLFSGGGTGEILLSSIPAGSVIVYYINDSAQPGGIFFDGFTLYINDENNYGADGNPILWSMKVQADGTPASTLTPVPAPVHTTNPGNGTMAIFTYPPFSFRQSPTPSLAQLFIRDWAAPSGTPSDTGDEPDNITAPNVVWESPDIGIAASPISGVPGLSSGAGQSNPFNPAAPPYTALSGQVDYTLPPGGDPSQVIQSDTAYVYVQVANVDSTASVGGETLKVYWAHASTALQWPDPWNGLIADSANATQTLGGLLGAVSLDSIPAGEACLVQIPWTSVPNPLLFTDSPPASAEQAHFCLLARIEGSGLYPFGMTYPEEWSFDEGGTLGTNVASNRGIAWRNIKIAAAGATGDDRIVKHPIEVLGGNHGLVEKVVGFSLQTLDATGTPVTIPGKVTIVASGSARERFLEAEEKCRLLRLAIEIVEFVEDLLGFKHLGDGRFEWKDLAKGVSNVRLRPGELLPFTVEFEPAHPVPDFALRVIQFEEKGGKQVVTGGQTFVFGNVSGFPAR